MAILLKPRVDVRPFHSFLKLKSFYELDFILTIAAWQIIQH